MLLLQLLSSLRQRSAHCSVSSSNSSSGNCRSRQTNSKRVQSWLVFVRPDSPLTPEPSVWRSSAAGRGRSGCRPCCGAGPSEHHPGYSPWTLSLTPSAHRRFMVTDHNYKKQQCIFLFGIHSSSLTCTIISKVSRIIRLASVARFPSISASCSSSALVLRWKRQNTS